MTTLQGQASLPTRLKAAAGDIKLAHSVFALPFAILAACMALDPASGVRLTRLAMLLGLVVVCMFFARTWAMLVNRWADRGIDGANPRTARRAIPAGRLSSADVVWFAGASALGFMLGCAGFWFAAENPWPLMLGAPALAWIALYSFTKRFTWLCHVFLGGALGASPLCSAIAIDPGALAQWPAILLLSGMVLCWVAGFDVIYALQDLEFDREKGLHSIPARLGARGAIWISRALHALAFTLLALAWRADTRFGLLFGVAVSLVGCLLIAEHVVLARRGKAGLEMAFFTLNGVVSCVLGTAGIADLLIA